MSVSFSEVSSDKMQGKSVKLHGEVSIGHQEEILHRADDQTLEYLDTGIGI